MKPFNNVSEARLYSKRHLAKGNGYCTVLVWNHSKTRCEAMVYSCFLDAMNWAGITFYAAESH